MCIFAAVIKKGDDMFTDTELKPYTMEEVNAMLDEAEAAFDAGDHLTNEEVFRELDKEFYTPEEAYDLVMSDIKPIYGIRDAV